MKKDEGQTPVGGKNLSASDIRAYCAPILWALISIFPVHGMLTSSLKNNAEVCANVFISEDSVKTPPVGVQALSGQYTTDWGAMGAAPALAAIPTLPEGPGTDPTESVPSQIPPPQLSSEAAAAVFSAIPRSRETRVCACAARAPDARDCRLAMGACGPASFFCHYPAGSGSRH